MPRVLSKLNVDEGSRRPSSSKPASGWTSGQVVLSMLALRAGRSFNVLLVPRAPRRCVRSAFVVSRGGSGDPDRSTCGANGSTKRMLGFRGAVS